MDTTQLDYHPGKGEEQHVVLKKDWLHKHTHQTAAVVALWFAWDFDASTAGLLADRCVKRVSMLPGKPNGDPSPQLFFGSAS